INEDKLKDFSLAPKDFITHLAVAKAKSLVSRFPEAILIGGDQVVSFQGRIIGKPGNREGAKKTLQELQGQTHEIVTAIAIVKGETCRAHVDITRLTMKPLTEAQIERYLDRDEPYDCAGSYKIEKHGISLFAKIETEDFSSITGLPLLTISKILGEWGLETP
ncbi:MAG: nucleoside triphosphate pyrophosphatase, partial [Pseudobdellovibrionaceae bacterium]